ncbi:unnamed protein product [Cyprideis torosa]|uniref:Uncharacterized protein n=1 Tax=Cyprideis torosa TaxID=163714 RepID=A0A7R8ZVT0_9CRUS|nr:unnamed protein product [Cyprideis torosa]CAG0903980.1 unnamed protein product [Cyprideis torosa]
MVVFDFWTFIWISFLFVCNGQAGFRFQQEAARSYGNQPDINDYTYLQETTLDIYKRYICLFLNPCDEGFVFDRYGGKCYFFDDSERKTWTEARDACRDRGASLATIRSRADITFIRDLGTRGIGVDTRGTDPNPDVVSWKGLSRTLNDIYSWDDGSPIDPEFVEFYTPPPLDTGKHECYLILNEDNYGFDDASCNNAGSRFSYVCQKDPIVALGINNFDHFPMPTIPSVEDSSYVNPNAYYSTGGNSQPYVPSPKPNYDIQETVLKIIKEELAYKLLPCPKGFFYDENIKKCYQASGWRRETCIDAERSCRRLGGQLASFQTRYEMMIFNDAHTPKTFLHQNLVGFQAISTGPTTTIAASSLGWISFAGIPREGIKSSQLIVDRSDKRIAGPVRRSVNCTAGAAVARSEERSGASWMEAPEETMPCEEGYFFYYLTGKCYIKGPDERSWYSARDYCASIGASLASFQSRLEQQFINKLGASARVAERGDPENFLEEKSVWVGGSSIGRAPWQWVNSSVEWTVAGLEGIENEDTCLVVYPDDFFGAGVGVLDENLNLPFAPYECQKNLLPFVCMKDPGIPKCSCSSNSYVTSAIQYPQNYYSSYHPQTPYYPF